MNQESHLNAVPSQTRMIAMGSRPLVECFSLIGFETWPDAGEAELLQLLNELLESDQKAFLLLESDLSQLDLAALSHVRTHGGRIIISEIPPLDHMENFTPYVEELVKKFGFSHE